jgi:hypothetical protein
MIYDDAFTIYGAFTLHGNLDDPLNGCFMKGQYWKNSLILQFLLNDLIKCAKTINIPGGGGREGAKFPFPLPHLPKWEKP